MFRVSLLHSTLRSLEGSGDAGFLTADPNLVEVVEAGGPSGLREGVLMRNPYKPGSMIALQHAEVELIKRRAYIVSAVASSLGATRVRLAYALIELDEMDYKVDIGGHGSVDTSTIPTPVKLSGHLHSSTVRKIAASLELDDTYAGGVPDVSEAKRIVEGAGLTSDADLDELISARVGGNPIRSRRVTVSLDREFRDDLKLGARLGLGPLAGLSGDYVRHLNSVRGMKGSITIDFE